jgi:DNA repair protein RadA/Sms
MEGRRPLLAELQALVAPSPLPQPRRTSNGVDASRLAMVLAVLERRCGVKLFNRDVYVSTVGGAKVGDPSADLAAAVAVASAAYDQSVGPRVIALGEIGLAGELRRVPGTDRRLAEAARLGFTDAVVPAESESARDRMTSLRGGVRVHAVPTLQHALAALSLFPSRRSAQSDEGARSAVTSSRTPGATSSA